MRCKTMSVGVDSNLPPRYPWSLKLNQGSIDGNVTWNPPKATENFNVDFPLIQCCQPLEVQGPLTYVHNIQHRKLNVTRFVGVTMDLLDTLGQLLPESSGSSAGDRNLQNESCTRSSKLRRFNFVDETPRSLHTFFCSILAHLISKFTTDSRCRYCFPSKNGWFHYVISHYDAVLSFWLKLPGVSRGAE